MKAGKGTGCDWGGERSAVEFAAPVLTDAGWWRGLRGVTLRMTRVSLRGLT